MPSANKVKKNKDNENIYFSLFELSQLYLFFKKIESVFCCDKKKRNSPNGVKKAFPEINQKKQKTKNEQQQQNRKRFFVSCM